MALRTTRQMIEVLSTGDSGETRVTRQTAAVVAAGSGKLRVYRQMIEVLAAEPGGAIHEESATNALALTAVATREASLSLAVDSDLALAQDAAGGIGHIYEASAQNALDLDHEGYLNLEGSGVLAVDGSASVLIVRSGVALSSDTLDQTAGFLAAYKRPAVSTLSLADQLNVVGPISQSATSELALAQAARKCEVFFASAASGVVPSGAAEAHGTIHLESASALSLQGMADLGVFNRTAVSEVGLSEEAVGAYCHGAVSHIELESTAVKGQITVSATSALSLGYDVRGNPITIGPGPDYDIGLPATTIRLTDAAQSSIRMMAAGSTVAVGEQLSVKRPWHVAAETAVSTITEVYDPVSHTLVATIEGLRDSVVAAQAHIPVGAGHYLQLTDAVAAVRVKAAGLDLSADSQLDLDYDLHTNEVGDAASFLLLAGAAVVDRCIPIETEVSLADVAAATIERGRDAASVLETQQATAFVIVRGAIPYQYHPFVGSGAAGAQTPPPSTLDWPVGGITAPFQLLYPAVGPVTDSVTLRAPNLGNKDRLSFNRVLRETRGGTLVVYADPIWPKLETLVLTFSGLNSAQARQLLAFMDAHLGEEVGLMDWEGRYWKGVIMTPAEPIVQDGKDSFSASMEFEGELVPA